VKKTDAETTHPKQTWDIIITPAKGFDWRSLKELFQYSDLVFLFVRRDFVAQYKQTILGPLWYVIQPLLMTVVFTVVFGNVADISTDGLPKPLFYMAGLTLWNFFQLTMVDISNGFVKNAQLLEKVFFPRIIVPISTLFSRYISFVIQFLLFLGIFFYYYFTHPGISPNLYLLFLPLIVIQVSVSALSVGMIITAVTVKYRDLQYLVQFGVQLWMYATPIVYPISKIPERWHFLLLFNPMAYTVDLFKYAFTGVGEHNLCNFGLNCLMTMLLAVWGTYAYTKAEKTFVDQV
jgi:lipopolysaccharide transport system permease protein